MIVLKFGGTSVGTAEAILKVKTILLNEPREKIIVCSAMSGVTDQLIKLSNCIEIGHTAHAIDMIAALQKKHFNIIEELTKNRVLIANTHQKIKALLAKIQAFVYQPYQENFHSIIITSGELLSTIIISNFLMDEGLPNTLLMAEDFMRITSPSHPNIESVKRNLSAHFEANTCCKLFVTQGFIYQKDTGDIGHFSRGGSDYSAGIIGAAVNATEVQIWTDVDGVLNNDPRCVTNTNTVFRLSYEEAAELAFFGAKILHPMTTLPLSERKIPIQVRNTFNHLAVGTIISEDQKTNDIKGVVAKDYMCCICIELHTENEIENVEPFVFEAFRKYEVAIDLSNSSRTSMVLAVTNHENLGAIIKHIRQFCTVTMQPNQTIVSIVGNDMLTNPKGLQIFNYLSSYHLKMIVYGASKNSISILIDTADKVKLLKTINDKLFGIKEELINQF